MIMINYVYIVAILRKKEAQQTTQLFEARRESNKLDK